MGAEIQAPGPHSSSFPGASVGNWIGTNTPVGCGVTDVDPLCHIAGAKVRLLIGSKSTLKEGGKLKFDVVGHTHVLVRDWSVRKLPFFH